MTRLTLLLPRLITTRLITPRFITPLFVIGALVGALLVSTAASAAPPERAAWVGVHLGANVVTDDWDLQATGNLQFGPSTSPLLGLRVGAQINKWFAAEVGLGVIPFSDELDQSGTALSYTLDLMAPFYQHDWQIFGVLGTGLYQNAAGALGSDVDAQIRWGLMMRGMLLDWMALRVDFRHVITDGYQPDAFIGNNIELSAGLDFFFWQTAQDRDGDGIGDDADRCPDEAGHKSAAGCPDKDHDGIEDRQDTCPNVRGLVELDGCPDEDQDGITDKKDRCPSQKGAAALGGCPDGDQDGVADIDDRCPKQAGSADNHGCPDQDQDGILDPDDACPSEAGPRRTSGCPDRDGDGIADKDDKCPTEHGIKALDGCMPKEVAAKFSGALEGIYFKTGSAKILSKSFPALDEAVAILKKYPKVRIGIAGYTDSRGNDQSNLELSQARAASCRQYLIDKGIAGGRIESTGYGEANPVATNKTKKGRAQNRRIEFKVLQ